jgi:hypothetical protein
VAFDTNIYFGIPGSLVTLPQPRNGVETTRVRPRQTFPLGNGEARARATQNGSRLFELSYNSIDFATHSLLLAFDQGHYGPGPFALLDPGERNMLTVNQSASTAQTNDATNFTVAGSGCSIASSTALVLPYPDTPRALAWSFNVSSPASGAANVTLDAPYPGWPGIPCVASRSLCFSCQIRGGGTDAVATFRLDLQWYDANEVFISTSSGTPVASASGAWAGMTCVAAAPSNAAFVLPRIQYITGASNGSIIYFARFQLEEGAIVGTWRPGTGVPPVVVVGYTDKWPWLYSTEIRTQPTFSLRQEGR